MAVAIEYLPCKDEALSSNPSTGKKSTAHIISYVKYIILDNNN
jgi:hypothetical protein